jgi:hypothetical protein
MYQEGPYYIWLWANLLVAVAVARAAAAGRFGQLASHYRWASFAVLGVLLLPLLWGQLRLAIYPQLEAGGLAGPVMGLHADWRMFPPTEIAAPDIEMEAPAAAPPFVQMAERVSKEAAGAAGQLEESIVTTGSRLTAPRYAPGTLLQTGPGIPSWATGRTPIPGPARSGG